MALDRRDGEVSWMDPGGRGSEYSVWSKDSTLVEEAAAMERRNPAEISVPLCMGDISCAGELGGLLGMGFNMRI